MQISTFIMAASVAMVARSQSLAGLPTCANPCVTQYSSGSTIAGCSTFDIACICRSSTFISSIACCLQSSCNAADQATAIAFAQNLCNTAGVTVPSSADGLCTSGAAQVASSSATSSSPASSVSSAASATSSRASTSSSAPMSGTTSMTASSAVANSATTSRAATSTAGANNIVAGANVGIAGGVAAILALLG